MSKSKNHGLAILVAVIAFVAFFSILGFGRGLTEPFVSTVESPDELANANTAFNTASVNAETGLIGEDTVVGDGVEAVTGKTVVVNYTGAFEDGTVFDTSVGRAPFEFTLGAGQVIAGWDQGVVGMKVGGQRVLVIPSDLAYGDQGYGPIPGKATLVFEIELLEVK
jgi:FKBP-type peptidyl-prolyl cis-trans isomerase FkpA